MDVLKRKNPEVYEDTSEFIWCLIGNAIGEHEFGEEKKLRNEIKHFRPGAKLYCFPPLWGDGYEKIKVIGVPRKSKKKITITMKSDWIINWRKQKVYDKFIIHRMKENGGWNHSEDSHRRLDILLNSLIKNRERNTM